MEEKNEFKLSKYKEGDSLLDYENLRDSLIDDNLNLYDISKERYEFLEDCLLNKENGLVEYVNNNYPSLSPVDKLQTQIELLNYLNKNKQLIDVDGGFLNIEFKNMQLSSFLVEEGLDGNLRNKENIKVLTNRVDDISEGLDFNKDELIDFICEIVDSNFTDNEKELVIEDTNTSIDIKNNLIEDRNSIDSKTPILKATPSEFRQRALAYAIKHGYTNGYYGAGSWDSYYTYNNAPSPYINYNSYPGNYDCANFVSQCLHEGGAQFWTGGNPWYFYSDSNRTSSWTGANQFKDHWRSRISYGDIRVNTTLSFLREATPISIVSTSGVATHTLISTTKHSNGYNFSYAAHSDKGKRSNLLERLKGYRIYYYKVYW